MIADWRRILRFLLVGGINTAFGYASYAMLVLTGMPLWLAVAGATVLAFLFNFFSYGGIVFGSTSHRLMPRFFVFYVAIGTLNFLLLRMLNRFGIGPLLAQAILLPFLAACSYFGMRSFVFRWKSVPPTS